MICPQCKNESECAFCENTGEVSEQLNKLYELGFKVDGSYNKEYRIYLQKALNELETISIDIVKNDDKLEITRIESSGPRDIIVYFNLDSVEQVIKFLRNN